MKRKLLLVLAVVLLVGVAGCMNGGGGDSPANGQNNSQMDGQQPEDGGGMGNGTTSMGVFGGCNAGQTMTFEEMRQQYDVGGMFEAGGRTPDASEVSGTVTVEGMVNHDGRQTCHVVIEYDEPIGSGGAQLNRVEMFGSDEDYADIIYYDTNDTRRMQVTLENNDTSFTIYDEQGNEMDIPTGGQMPGNGQMPR